LTIRLTPYTDYFLCHSGHDYFMPDRRLVFLLTVARQYSFQRSWSAFALYHTAHSHGPEKLRRKPSSSRRLSSCSLLAIGGLLSSEVRATNLT